MTRFLIFTAGRTGSETLVRILDGHPAVTCDSEVLARRRPVPALYLAGRTARSRLRGGQAYGYKVLHRHLSDVQRVDPARYLRRAVEGGWEVIHLTRRNRLHQAVSAIRARRTEYHYTAANRPAFEPLHADPAEVIAAAWLLDNLHCQEQQALDDLPRLDLVYEDHLRTADQQDATARLVTDLLGLPPSTSRTDLVRVNPPRLRDMLANYDEVARAAVVTRFAVYLDDG